MGKTAQFSVQIPVDSFFLDGLLTVPKSAVGIVVFVHGSGSSRLSPRNQFVAGVLNKASIATLLFDLLTEEEDVFYQTRFDIELLTKRLIFATDFVERDEKLCQLGIGYFGASTGSAAALCAAAKRGKAIRAVVSRGGRPDLAGEALSQVVSPTLLIVGRRDVDVLGLNRQALRLLTCTKKLEIVAGATHLFEEPGALEEAAQLSVDWFTKFF